MIDHASPDRLLLYLVSLSGVYAVSRWPALRRFHEGRGLPSLGLSAIACFVLTPAALDSQDMLLETFVGTWCVTHSLIYLFEVDGRVRWLTMAACAIACLTVLSAAFQTVRPTLLWLVAAAALLSNVMESLRLFNGRAVGAVLPVCVLLAIPGASPNTALEFTFISLGMLTALAFARSTAATEDGSLSMQANAVKGRSQ